MERCKLLVVAGALLSLAFPALPRVACAQGLGERLRREAAKSPDPVAYWIDVAEKNRDESIREIAIHRLAAYPDDNRAIQELERLSIMPPEAIGHGDPPMYPTKARNRLTTIYANREWKKLKETYPKPEDLVAPAEEAFLKTDNPELKGNIRRFLDLRGDKHSIMFLIKEDKDSLDEDLCDAIAARIKEGNEELYQMCLGFLRKHQTVPKGPNRNAQWAATRQMWVGATVAGKLKRLDALDELITILSLEGSLYNMSLDQRALDAVVGYRDSALPTFDTFLKKPHAFREVERAWIVIARIGGKKSVQLLERERPKYEEGSSERKSLEYWISVARHGSEAQRVK